MEAQLARCEVAEMFGKSAMVTFPCICNIDLQVDFIFSSSEYPSS